MYAVTYFEAAPADVTTVATDLKEYVAASRKEAGNLAFAAFEESGRPSRFAILAGWHPMHMLAQRQPPRFDDKAQPLLVGPFEVRDSTAFSLDPPAATAPGAEAVYG